METSTRPTTIYREPCQYRLGPGTLMCLTWVDTTLGLLQVFPVRYATHLETIKCLTTLSVMYGMPRIESDQSLHFTDWRFHLLYNPTLTGLMGKNFKKPCWKPNLHALSQAYSLRSWTKNLPEVMQTLNGSLTTTHGITPYEWLACKTGPTSSQGYFWDSKPRSEIDGQTVLLRTPVDLSSGEGCVDLKLSWKVVPYWVSFVAPEGTTKTVRGRRSQLRSLMVMWEP